MTENQIIYSVTGDEDGYRSETRCLAVLRPTGGIEGSNADDPKTTNTEGEHK